MTKGGMVMQGKVDAKGMAYVRAHLGLHPQTDSPALFVTDVGKALTYWDGRQIWRCIQQRSGVRRLGSHLIRHTDGKNMAHQGAAISDIEDVLGHESDKMTRHFAGEARKLAAANLMTKYSLAGGRPTSVAS